MKETAVNIGEILIVFYKVDLFSPANDGMLTQQYFNALRARRDYAPMAMTVYLVRVQSGCWQTSCVWTIWEMMQFMRQGCAWGKYSSLRRWLFQPTDSVTPLMNACGPITQQFVKPVTIHGWFDVMPILRGRPLSLIKLMPTDSGLVQLIADNGRIPPPHPPLPAHSPEAHRS